LSAAEEKGHIRRGYVVEGLGAAQFATAGAVDRIRAVKSSIEQGTGLEQGEALVLAATDPANAYGAALPWPEQPAGEGESVVSTHGTSKRSTSGDACDPGLRQRRMLTHRPGRKAGALVVLVDGVLVLYVERGGKSVLSWTNEPGLLRQAADALATAVREGILGRLTVERTDGEAALTSAVGRALEEAGFQPTPRGMRLRR
jgi:ATP-dependent Lhr-like helicase